ncbi:hypothetical protein HZA86_01280 [Candidatus Uhrbacteria bacterium]|nr:hypothetical protein [Candidatus Uhrbacteria bacterium]
MSTLLQWLNFIQPATESPVIRTAMAVAVLLVAIGLFLPPIVKRRSSRWMMEWASEVRMNAFSVGVAGLLLTWLSGQRVVVLGARAWYVLLALLVVWRAYTLWGRYKHWGAKEKDEYRRLQQLKYIPGR